jgi:2-alkenal reductase
VNRVVPQIIKNGRAPRPGIGIIAGDERVNAQLGVRGVVIMGVRSGSPAERAGLRPFDRRTGKLGDVIVGVNGKTVLSVADLVAALDDVGVGNEATLAVQRDNQQVEVKVRVVDMGE